MTSVLTRLSQENEKVWTRVGKVAQTFNEEERTLYCFENVLKHNHFNLTALKEIANIYKTQGEYHKAIEYYHRALNVQGGAETWCDLGYCLLYTNQYGKAYSAFHHSLYRTRLSTEESFQSKIWYGIGVIYEKFALLDHAEDCFKTILSRDQGFPKASELYFRLGLIYKIKKKYDESIRSFQFIEEFPPKSMKTSDILFQIGHVYESKRDFKNAFESYQKAIKIDPKHYKVLLQIAWLYFREDVAEYTGIDKAIEYLETSIESNGEHGQTHYLLGRCYMEKKEFKKAFDAYQKAVFRNGKNPLFWTSIGVLYFSINQRQDALDAYTKAIKLNNAIGEAWYNLGTLYESCNQMDDALSAYKKAAELKPNDPCILSRLRKHHLPAPRNISQQVPSQKVVFPNIVGNNGNGQTNGNLENGGNGTLKSNDADGNKNGSSSVPPTTTETLRNPPLISNGSIGNNSSTGVNNGNGKTVTTGSSSTTTTTNPSVAQHIPNAYQNYMNPMFQNMMANRNAQTLLANAYTNANQATQNQMKQSILGKRSRSQAMPNSNPSIHEPSTKKMKLGKTIHRGTTQGYPPGLFYAKPPIPQTYNPRVSANPNFTQLSNFLQQQRMLQNPYNRNMMTPAGITSSRLIVPNQMTHGFPAPFPSGMPAGMPASLMTQRLRAVQQQHPNPPKQIQMRRPPGN